MTSPQPDPNQEHATRTPADHYAEAERMLTAAAERLNRPVHPPQTEANVIAGIHLTLAMAQVHATLATCGHQSAWGPQPAPPPSTAYQPGVCR